MSSLPDRLGPIPEAVSMGYAKRRLVGTASFVSKKRRPRTMPDDPGNMKPSLAGLTPVLERFKERLRLLDTAIQRAENTKQTTIEDQIVIKEQATTDLLQRYNMNVIEKLGGEKGLSRQHGRKDMVLRKERTAFMPNHSANLSALVPGVLPPGTSMLPPGTGMIIPGSFAHGSLIPGTMTTASKAR